MYRYKYFLTILKIIKTTKNMFLKKNMKTLDKNDGNNEW